MHESQRHLVESGGDQILAAVGKASPAIAVTTASAGGLSLEQWVFVATLVYLVLQTAHLAWKWARDLRRAKREDLADV